MSSHTANSIGCEVMKEFRTFIECQGEVLDDEQYDKIVNAIGLFEDEFLKPFASPPPVSPPTITTEQIDNIKEELYKEVMDSVSKENLIVPCAEQIKTWIDEDNYDHEEQCELFEHLRDYVGCDYKLEDAPSPITYDEVIEAINEGQFGEEGLKQISKSLSEKHTFQTINCKGMSPYNLECLKKDINKELKFRANKAKIEKIQQSKLKVGDYVRIIYEDKSYGSGQIEKIENERSIVKIANGGLSNVPTKSLKKVKLTKL